jgi:hypothetical protein
VLYTLNAADEHAVVRGGGRSRAAFVLVVLEIAQTQPPPRRKDAQRADLLIRLRLLREPENRGCQHY